MIPSSRCPQEIYQLMKGKRQVEEGSPSWGESTEVLSHSCYRATGLYLGEKTVLVSPHGKVNLLEDMGFSV